MSRVDHFRSRRLNKEKEFIFSWRGGGGGGNAFWGCVGVRVQIWLQKPAKLVEIT